ncbi:hypothetical protein [Nissabacter sp. SGAir0207]|uniref:hypothetical protein n=1 Tax=Nissabacter sp. SGAir0207 TaxID=2126321 RepID=UPI0010CCCAB6|nr:hypothetical protein [Nissabacter sp. SGAir0207]QCR38912.1 hypothetical protein C1N62_22645 [Nissabacter sp. SGAir0207]
MSVTDMNELNIAKINAEIAKQMAETSKLMAETKKLHAEAVKYNRETFWYPLAISSGIIGAVVTVTTLIFKLLGVL